MPTPVSLLLHARIQHLLQTTACAWALPSGQAACLHGAPAAGFAVAV